MAEDWKRVGKYVRDRRKHLGLRQEDLQPQGGPSPALVRQLENGRYDADMQENMRAGLERSLEWAPGSLADVLAGGEPTDLPSYDKNTTFRDDLDEQLETALARFQQAATQLVYAEAEFDSAMRRWAIQEMLRQRVRAAVEGLEEETGRRLTVTERLGSVQSLTRPTPAEIAEFIGWAAMHDVREWTRYEMALIEVIDPDYPRDVRAGSAYADLGPFRERVKRLGHIKTMTEHESGERQLHLSGVPDTTEVPEAAHSETRSISEEQETRHDT